MAVALWVLASVAVYLAVGWVGAMTWLPPSNWGDSADRGMAVVFSPPIGLLMLFMVLVDGCGWIGWNVVRGIGKLVPSGRR